MGLNGLWANYSIEFVIHFNLFGVKVERMVTSG